MWLGDQSCHNFLKGRKIHFHAPIGALVQFCYVVQIFGEEWAWKRLDRYSGEGKDMFENIDTFKEKTGYARISFTSTYLLSYIAYATFLGVG